MRAQRWGNVTIAGRNWRDVTLVKDREALVSKHGVRGSENLRVPTPEPTKNLTTDIIHTSFLGVVQDHARKTLVGLVKRPLMAREQ